MKGRSLFFLTVLCLGFGFLSFAQTLPVGAPVLEEAARRMQINGNEKIKGSFTLRPVSADFISALDSTNLAGGYITHTRSFANGKGSFSLLPFTFKQQYNSHHPYGWNDGSMIQARGYQGQASFGFYSKLGPLSIQLQPEAVYAQNRNFSTFPSTHPDSLWKGYYDAVLNMIDAPEKYGNGSFFKMFPGQSSIRLNYKKLSLGLSSENLWWGPGIRNSLIMSNNATGFPHVTLNTSAPLHTGIGDFEGQLISGVLKSSGILPDTNRTFNGQKLYIPKPIGKRYLNGLILTWQPKWTKGLYLGTTRAFYQYRSDLQHSFSGYVPVFGKLFKRGMRNEDAFKRDQMISFFFRLLLPKEKAEVYGEFGRNDHSENLRDLMVEPEHSRAYILGLRKLFETTGNADFELLFEMTNMQLPPTSFIREQGSWYAHYQVRDGYTNQGQVIGAGIGPGGNSQSIGFNWVEGIKKTGFMIERVIHNNDFYFNVFTPMRNFGAHWTDISLNFNKTAQYKRLVYEANLSLIRSLNYHWKYNRQIDKEIDANNVHARFSVSYLF